MLEYLTGVRPPLGLTAPGVGGLGTFTGTLPGIQTLAARYRQARQDNTIDAFENEYGSDVTAFASSYASQNQRQQAKTEKDYDTFRDQLRFYEETDKDTGAASEQEYWDAAEKFTGTIVFDEAHKMRNDTTKTARMGAKLRRLLPNAKVIYMSATPVTRVDEMSYADRLGLWGPGTAFGGHYAFAEAMNKGGFATKEIVAKDMKALGMYLRRQLDYSGVADAKHCP